jgi:ABC-type antimicrobial peptide transport system permease subunit
MYIILYRYITTSYLQESSFLGIIAALVILVAGIIITVVTVTYRRQKLYHRNQEIPQGIYYTMFHNYALVFPLLLLP